MTPTPIHTRIRSGVPTRIRQRILSRSPSADPTYERTYGLTKNNSPTVQILQLSQRARKPKPNPTTTAPLTRHLQRRRPAVTGKAVLGVLALAALLSGCGCSIDSTENRMPTHCVRAHDEFPPGANGVVTLCDEYDPTAGAKP